MEVSLVHVRIGNNSGPWTLVRIVEVSVIGGVCLRRFHCTTQSFLPQIYIYIALVAVLLELHACTLCTPLVK